MRRLAATLALATLAAPTLASAQDTGAPAPQLAAPPMATPAAPTAGELPAGSPDRGDLPELTFEQAIALARKNNRTIKVDRANLAAAQTQTETAWSALLPTLAAQGKYTHNYAQFEFPFTMMTTDAAGNTVTTMKKLLIQPKEQLDGVINATTPVIAPAAWAGLKSVDANVRSAEANFAAQEATLLVQVGESFLAAAGTDELVEARHSSVTVARATLKDAEVRLAAGSVTKVDVDRAQFTVVRTEQQEREALTQREQAYRTLGTLLQSKGRFKVSTSFPTAPMPDPNDVQLALKLRPEFRALEEQAKASEQEANARAWQWAPTISAFGNARKFNYDNFGFNRYSWAVGGQLDWLLFDGGNRDALRHQANAQAAAAREQAAVFADRVRDDLANTSSDLRTKQQGVQAAQQAVALSTESLELIRTQYTAGTATQLDLLQAQDALITAEVSLAQSRFDLQLSDLNAQRIAGTFPAHQ